MKSVLFKIVSFPLVVIVHFVRPAATLARRFWYTTLLSVDVRALDYSVQCDGPVDVSGTKNISIGKRCRIGTMTELRTMEAGNIHFGDDIRLNRGCTVVSYSHVSIDEFTIIGEFVSIRDANHGMNLDEPMRYQDHTSSPIHIGRDVWIGRGSCILPGVTIGDGAVIGANSVVTTDIPHHVIAAGAPAKIIRERE